MLKSPNDQSGSFLSIGDIIGSINESLYKFIIVFFFFRVLTFEFPKSAGTEFVTLSNRNRIWWDFSFFFFVLRNFIGCR